MICWRNKFILFTLFHFTDSCQGSFCTFYVFSQIIFLGQLQPNAQNTPKAKTIQKNDWKIKRNKMSLFFLFILQNSFWNGLLADEAQDGYDQSFHESILCLPILYHNLKYLEMQYQHLLVLLHAIHDILKQYILHFWMAFEIWLCFFQIYFSIIIKSRCIWS